MVDGGTRVDSQAAVGKVCPQQKCDSLSTWPGHLSMYLFMSVFVYLYMYFVIGNNKADRSRGVVSASLPWSLNSVQHEEL